jgi:predicted Zn-dependent protease
MNSSDDRDTRSNALFDEAMRLRDTGAYSEASRVLRELIASLPPDERRLRMHSHLQLGHIAEKLADEPQAEVEFRAASAIAPNTELPSLGLFHALLTLQRQTEALEEALRFVSQRESLGYRELFAGDAFREEMSTEELRLAEQIREHLARHREAQRGREAPCVGDTVRIADAAPAELRPGELARLRKMLDGATDASVELADGERVTVPLSLLSHRDL